MRSSASKTVIGVVFACLVLVFLRFAAPASGQKKVAGVSTFPNIPRVWDEAELASMELPLAELTATPHHVSAEYYYSMPIRPVYKSYPIYEPSKAPVGYKEWLKQQEPEVVFDPSKLKTTEDWIHAGELVFSAPLVYNSAWNFDDPELYKKTGMPLTKEGASVFGRYVIREKGKIEIGIAACSDCHTRVMQDGAIIKGAQSNIPLDRLLAYGWRSLAANSKSLDRLTGAIRQSEYGAFAAPWLKADPSEQLRGMTIDQIASVRETIPPGLTARQGTSSFYPVRIPDLIGVKDRVYLDSTGLERHRSIGDLMRYGALNQGGDSLSSFGGFIPKGENYSKLPDPQTQSRYSDEQLYALALYLYSLKPPPNPNKFDDVASRGKKVFEREGCSMCHVPPLYTSNKLTLAKGFTPSEDALKKYDILQFSVETDPTLALRTRRGTGFYKVPSLKGVWYRGPFEHNGSVATLDDWLDKRRTREDYTPTGFVGFGIKKRAVVGHPFGLDLSPEDKKALISFLKTL